MPINHDNLYSHQGMMVKMKCMSPYKQTVSTVNGNRRSINAERKVSEGLMLSGHTSFLALVIQYGPASLFDFHLFCLIYVVPKCYRRKDEGDDYFKLKHFVLSTLLACSVQLMQNVMFIPVVKQQACSGIYPSSVNGPMALFFKLVTHCLHLTKV